MNLRRLPSSSPGETEAHQRGEPAAVVSDNDDGSGTTVTARSKLAPSFGAHGKSVRRIRLDVNRDNIIRGIWVGE